LAHLGIAVVDIELLTDFYRSVFGLQVTDRGRGRLTRSRVHEQFPVSASPAGAGLAAPDQQSTVFQISFKVTSIDELRDIRTRAVEHVRRRSWP
jgi:catechol 2,3-dioxygenase